jgi:predicted transcriptional regulator
VIITPIEQEILNYLKDNPGVSKADVVRHMRDNQKASKMTVFDYLGELESKNMIYSKKKRPNSQSYMMYVNDDNRILFILLELDKFKQAYSLLLQKTKEAMDKKDYSESAKALGLTGPDRSKWSLEDINKYYEFEMSKLDEFERAILESSDQEKHALEEQYFKKYGDNIGFLLFSPVRLFYTVVDIIFYLSMLRWPNQIKDEKVLSQIYSITYHKIAEIQLQLSKFIESTIIFDPERVIVQGRKFPPEVLSVIIAVYEMSGISEIENVINSLRTLNEDIKELTLLRF